MKFTTTREKLTQGVATAERLSGKRESLPILSCILFEAKDIVMLRSTNLEAGVEIRIQSDIVEKGSIAVPAVIISQTLRSIAADKVTLRSEGGNLLVEARGTKTLIKAIPHEEFPKLPEASTKKDIQLSREDILHGLSAVSYAASVSMVRPELGSIYLSVKDGEVVFAATDSFRLAEKKIKSSGKGESEILIPLKHASELSFILERSEAKDIVLHADESQLSLLAGPLHYVSRVVDGTFPNYHEIIPRSFTTQATILKNDLADILKKARVFSGADQRVGFHVYPKKKIFSATAQAPAVGEMSDSIDAALEGDDIDINFNVAYVSDCLSAIGADSIVLGFSGVGKPLVIRGVSDASFTYLVMPLNR